MKTDWSTAVHEATGRKHEKTISEKQREVERLIGIIQDQDKQLEVALAISSAKPDPEKILKVKSGSGGAAVAFAIASDWHVEETIEGKTVNGLNEFNLTIARQRVRSFFHRVVRMTEIQRAGTKIDTLVLALLGDLMTGYIHDELRENNGLSPTETILWLQDELAAGLQLLDKHFERIIIPCSWGNHGRCHDPETELLTWEGWRRFTDIKKGDIVATYNMKTGKQEWQPLLDVYVDLYDGPMIHVTNMGLDFMVTPAHRMVLKSSYDGSTKFMEMQHMDKNTHGHSFFPKTATGLIEDYDDITDDELLLLGWLWTDGGITQQNGALAYRIYQSKPTGCAAIRDLLARLGYTYGEYVRHRKPPVISGIQCLSSRPAHAFNISQQHSPRLADLMPEKHKLPEWFKYLSQRQVLVFMEAVRDGDGTVGKNPDGHYEVYGRHECLDELQALLMVNGVSARLRTDKRGHGVLSVRSTTTGRITRCKWDESVKTISYKGIIWCGTVENGTLITRRNGFPLISGNTTLKSRHATGAKNSYEWMLYHVMRKNFPHFDWRISDGYHNYLDVDGRIIRLHHGDNLAYQGGVGGLTIPVLKAIAQWNKAIPAYLDVFGHWHQSVQLPNFISNGALIGFGPYALSIKAGFEPPSQTFFLLDAKRGRTVTCPIFFD